MTSMSKCQIVPTAKRPKMLFIPRKQSSGCDMILPDFRGESPPFIYESPPTPYGSDSDDEEIFDWPETLIGESQLNWSSSSAIPVCFKFTDKPEFLGEQVDNPSSPVSYFRLIFNSELSCELVKQINKNKPKNVTNKLWPRTNEQEVNEFISILMQMSILQVIRDLSHTENEKS